VIQSSKGVFLSYASEDAGVAKRICEALRVAGIEVWFDQSELRGGDAWDQKIRQQIRDCALFVPIISEHTQARPEGYFRLEWKLAVDRSHLMAAEKTFLVPVVVDATMEPEALVPTQFRDVQWTRIRAGEVPAAFVDRIAALLNQPVAPHVGSPERGVSRAPARRLSVVLTALSIAAVVALVTATAIRAGWLWHKPVPKLEASTAFAPVATTPAAIPEKSVAVLPFLDMSEKKDQEYFSDGLSEELIDMLTKIPELRVPARTSSFYFKGKQATVADIAKALGVAHVLEGSVRKSGNTLRITAQLVRADNGYHLWSETYDRQLNDIFKIQDEIAAAVVKALKVSLLESPAQRVAPTTSTEAYTLYVQARALILHSSPTDNARAADYLERAIQLDPKYAPAWARLTQTRTFQYEMRSLSFEQAREEARRSAQRALELDPNLAAAHLSMARVYRFFDWNWDAVGVEIQRARQLDPGDADALRWAGVHALGLGHVAEAIDLVQQAVDLDPLDGANYTILGAANLDIGRYAAADFAFRKAVELAPPSGFGSHEGHARVLLATGQAAAALAVFDELEDAGDREWGKALAYFELGRKADSDTAVMNLESNFAETHAYQIAQVHVYRSEIDQAFNWLDHAYREHDRSLSVIKADPFMKTLRGDPRYRALVRKMNLPE
jgi:TolB-like protein